jgi:hypothetical protein
LTTSTNLIKQAVLLQGFMAGEADNSFDMLKIRFELDRIISFPYRGFFTDKVLFANSSPANNTNSNGVRIFAFSGAFIAFHKLSSGQKKLLLYPKIFNLECIYKNFLLRFQCSVLIY